MWPLLAQAQDDGVRNTIDTLARTPISVIVYIVAACTVLRIGLYSILKNVAPHQRGAGFGIGRFVNEALDAVVYALVFVFLLIRPFGVQAFTIPTGSMVPTLMVGDFIVANKAVYRYSDPKVGDIVVFKPPTEALIPPAVGKDVDYIKRVQGVPGDVVEVRNNVLYRQGKPAADAHRHFTNQIGSDFVEIKPEEAERFDFKLVKYQGEYWPLMIQDQFVNHTSRTADKYRVSDQALMHELRELPAEAVPPGHILVMGDNRNGSFDSRGWGLVERWRVIGRSEVTWWPMRRWGRTR